MKYCQYCGTQLVDDAKFCSNCGKMTMQIPHEEKQQSETSSNNHQNIVNMLSSRLKTNGIIWLVIACVQILIGLFGVWFTLIVGVLNIISAITDIKNSKRILTNQNGIVKAYEPITNAIIALIYNVVIGGIIGVLGSIYYLVFVRGFVMENKNQFLEMETENPIQNTPNIHNDKTIYVDVVLTEQEAINGVQKEITLDGMQSPLKVNFPKNMKEGNTLALRSVKISEKNGETTQKDVYIKIIIQK